MYYDYLSEMKPFELFHERILLSMECEQRMHIWDMATNEADLEKAESAYYDTADALSHVCDEITARGLEHDYKLYKAVIYGMGWVNE